MPPTKTRPKADAIEELLKKGEGQGGPAVEALRKAARLTHEKGDLFGAIGLLEEAVQKAASGPCEPRLYAAAELELGALYESELGRLDQAMSHYQNAFKLDPDSPQAIEAGRRIFRTLGDWNQVARLYEVEVETSNDPGRRGELLVQLGLIRAKKTGDLVGAAVRLEEAVRLRPSDEVAKEALASLYVSPDFPSPPGDTVGPPERAAQLFLELAAARRKAPDRDAEVAYLKRALGADPYHLDAAMRLEQAYAEDRLESELRHLYRLDAPVPRRNQKRALLAARAGDLDEATEAALAAHAEGDDAHEAIAEIERRLEEKKDHAGIAAFREQILETTPMDERARADRLLEIAALYQKAGLAPKQEAALRNALAFDPGHPEAFKQLADHLAARRDHVGLVTLVEAAIEEAPIEEQPRRLAELAELYEKKVGDAGAAADAWRRAEAIVPSQRGASELRRLQLKQERWVSLTHAIERELAQAPVGPARADVLKRLAQVHRERHQLTEARQHLEEAIELKPDDAGLYRSLADLSEQEGQPVEVAKILRRQLKASKEKVEKLNLLRRLALLYDERLSDLDGSIWACEEILGFLPGDRDALKRLEALYERSGPEGEEPLIAILEKHAQAAATPAERIPLLHRLAAIYEGREDFAAAVERLERILKLDKTDLKAQDAIARSYEKLERWADAALALERVIQRAHAPSGEPVPTEVWKRFARIVDGRLGDPARAVKAWREVLDKRPTDREALEAMARQARARGDQALLDDVLARRQAHAEGDEAANIAIERAGILEARKDPAGAAKLYRAVLDDLDPRSLEAHARLRAIEHQAGRFDASLRIAERQLFLSDDETQKLALALEIARAWRTEAKDARRAISAFERVIDLDPTENEALGALATLYGDVGDFERQVVIDEHRLSLAEAAGDTPRAVELLFELAMTAEEKQQDPARAFEYFKRALELDPEGGTLGELRRVAEQHGLWEEMCGVYATQKGLEPRLRVAEVADERLNDPARAFAVLKGSLPMDPDGETLLPELERLSVRAADPAGLLEVYESLYERRPERLELLRKRASVREERMQDPSGALDEVLRAFRVDPDDLALLAEIRRLAGVTGRWEDALAVEGFRFFRAASPGERLDIALEAAELVEAQVKDPLRAFRAYLRAFQLAPADLTIRDHLWRLAAQIGTIDEKGGEAPAASETARRILSESPPQPARYKPPIPRARAAEPLGGAQPIAKPGREPTLEIKLDELIVEDSKPLQLDLPPERPPVRDPTVELSLQDLMPILKKPPAHPRTIDLSISDLAPATPASSERPPRTPRFTPPPRPEPPAPAQPRTPALAGPHSAWDELAAVILALPAPDEATHFAHLVAVSEMWEKGARDLDRAFESLASAFEVDPDSEEARAALERLAAANDAWDRLVGVLDATIEATGSAARAVRLLIDSAGVRERQGQLKDAEDRYLRALGIQPASAGALERLEALYRQSGRHADLASLLERRLHGLLEKLPPGEPRRLRAIELATTYEKLGNTYEAIDAWRHVAEENPDHAQAFAELARLYESVGQWSKVVESLTRELDLLDAGGEKRSKEALGRSVERRRRIGEIYEKELELPERAIEAWSAVLEADPDDRDAETALERLYLKLGRFTELEALLDRRGAREKDAEARALLFERRAAILTDKLHDDDGAVAVLQKLRRLRPDDTELGRRLEETLGRAGHHEEQAELLKERIAQAHKRGAPASERAHLSVELGRLQAALGDAAEAQRALEHALELAPNDPQALAELARLREGGSDWDGYATAREREAEVAASPEQALRALLDAARVHIEKRKDDAAARRCLERALERDGKSAEALEALGALLRRAGDSEGADALARRELALDGDRAVAAARRADLHVALGTSLLKGGLIDEAGHEFREAMGAVPGHPGAIEGLADVAARHGAWEEVEALLRGAASSDGVRPEVAAQLYRRLAAAAEESGRGDEAHSALLEADRLVPGDLRTRLALGENRYKVHRYREAAQHLGALADHPELATLPHEAGEALYHGALAELKLRRPERSLELLERAVKIHPGHAEALGLLAERAIESGDLPRAVDLLERQAASTDAEAAASESRALRFERVADVILSELKDAPRALRAYEQALEAAPDGQASAALLDKALVLQRDSGKLEQAANSAARLLEREAPPPERARRLREAAALDSALGKAYEARARLKEALELDPLSHETLAGLSAMLVQEGADEEAAQLLTRALPLYPPPADDAGQRAARASLWMRLGECRERLRDSRGATSAFEKALEYDPSRRPLREAVVARYGDDPAQDPVVRAHRMVLLASDPLHVPSLRSLYQIEARTGAADGGRRFLELLAVAGALSDEERRALSASAPAERSDGSARSLDEADHARLAHPDALALAPVFAALWEGTAPERAPDLAAFGVKPEDRVSPVGQTQIARAYSSCALALGNRKTGLYQKPDPSFTAVKVVAHPPTAIVVGGGFADGRALPDVRFLLGRALEIARPEYVLAEALTPAEFTRLFASILRAFHPRHSRRRLETGSDQIADEAAKWKRALPYKVARRLAEQLGQKAETEFSSARWRRAVGHTGNRAGLVAAGDLCAAARVLTAEGDQEGLRELARFAASDDYLALRAKVVSAPT